MGMKKLLSHALNDISVCQNFYRKHIKHNLFPFSCVVCDSMKISFYSRYIQLPPFSLSIAIDIFTMNFCCIITVRFVYILKAFFEYFDCYWIHYFPYRCWVEISIFCDSAGFHWNLFHVFIDVFCVIKIYEKFFLLLKIVNGKCDATYCLKFLVLFKDSQKKLNSTSTQHGFKSLRLNYSVHKYIFYSKFS